MKKRYIEVSIVSLVCLVLVFLIFNWTIRAVIHNRSEVIVPKIEGKSLQDAMDTISVLGLGVIKEGEEFSAKLPPGTVLRQTPNAGMTVRQGKIIRIMLSRGSDLVFVPDVVGQTTKVAELIIRKNQLVYNVSDQVYSLRYEKNKIISQKPDANSVADKNVPVDVLVSLGEPPEGMILMPDFVGKDINEFKGWSEKNKITYQIKEEEYESAAVNVIVGQEPPSDTVVTYTTIVLVTVSKGSKAALNTASQPAGEVFHYEVPQGAKEQKVQVMLIDSTGEHQIFSSIQLPGSKIDIPIMKKGRAKLRMFINNILVEEKEL